jgi:hypothetical protein
MSRTIKLTHEQQLFTESAWLLYNNRERILADPRMAYAPIDMGNWLMYSGVGAFNRATIAVYLDWWQECKEAVAINADGKRGLIVRFGGSPLSALNKCLMVDENGALSETHAQNVHVLWRPFCDICRRYADSEKPESPYCLEEIVQKIAQFPK